MHIHLEKTLKNSDPLVSCTYYFWRPTSIVLPPELSSIWLSESGSWGSPIRLRLGTPRDPAILCLLRAGITTLLLLGQQLGLTSYITLSEHALMGNIPAPSARAFTF